MKRTIQQGNERYISISIKQSINTVINQSFYSLIDYSNFVVVISSFFPPMFGWRESEEKVGKKKNLSIEYHLFSFFFPLFINKKNQ